ncbi:MAG: sugar ABC transporter permease [Defluviitaleaceae bacterium]|nr:sugar ABC transporter permease [Defluviitaleaceae bacterium]
MWYILPALLFYGVFMAYPLLDSVRLSFFTGRINDRTFVGFDNFIRLFTDPVHSERYINAFANTWYFFFIHIVVQNGLGIFFATLLTAPKMRGSKIYQAIIFIPTTFAVLVTGYLWKLLLNPVWSRPALTEIGLGGLAQPWLGNPDTALTAVSLVSSWQWMGIPTMMFVAGLMNISEDIYEAADIDGANAWTTFFFIKLPLLLPIVGMVAILTFVNNFNAFDIVFAMTTVNGAPGFSTDLIGVLFYRTGIAGQHPIGIPDPGMGAAIATITFIMLAVVSMTVLYFTRTKE